MKKSFGKIFYELRKEKGLTQEEVAQKLNISSQAVSKWENDLTYPDVTLLVAIAEMFNTTVDFLLGKDNEPLVKMVDKADKLDIKSMFLKLVVNSADGDKVRMNLPLSLLKVALETGVNLSATSTSNKALEGIDFAQILHLVEEGVIGKLFEVISANGDIVEIYVE